MTYTIKAGASGSECFNQRLIKSRIVCIKFQIGRNFIESHRDIVRGYDRLFGVSMASVTPGCELLITPVNGSIGMKFRVRHGLHYQSAIDKRICNVNPDTVHYLRIEHSFNERLQSWGFRLSLIPGDIESLHYHTFYAGWAPPLMMLRAPAIYGKYRFEHNIDFDIEKIPELEFIKQEFERMEIMTRS
jgi:hypothetical protein